MPMQRLPVAEALEDAAEETTRILHRLRVRFHEGRVWHRIKLRQIAVARGVGLECGLSDNSQLLGLVDEVLSALFEVESQLLPAGAGIFQNQCRFEDAEVPITAFAGAVFRLWASTRSAKAVRSSPSGKVTEMDSGAGLFSSAI